MKDESGSIDQFKVWKDYFPMLENIKRGHIILAKAVQVNTYYSLGQMKFELQTEMITSVSNLHVLNVPVAPIFIIVCVE